MTNQIKNQNAEKFMEELKRNFYEAERNEIVKRNLLIVLFEARQDLAEQLQVFKKEIERFSTLDIDDVQVVKHVLKRLIQKIEVFEGGKIKIHYNLSNPLLQN
ncbi:hypothetical protein WMW72_20445 [Paenibacillus filicis]|uniref:DUF4368 domain-containing protein n=1 Tax=Paenibacillus filicis TaxID=669464 RepID=A0ABU9DN39_9BACL